MLKLLPLGGIGSVTKNMYVYDLDGQILMVDCGVGFPDENMPGVDLLIPDWSWLEDKKDRILGIVLTHGHDDHIAGLPYILPKIGIKLPVWASRLTAAFAQGRMKEFGLDNQVAILNDNQPLKLGPFVVHSIKVTHSVPDSRHLVIETPDGIIYHGSDFKFDLTPVDAVRPEFQKIAHFGDKGITLLLSDSLRSESAGVSLSESLLEETFEREIRGTRGRFIVTTISSNVHRVQQAINVAAGYNRKIALIGRSIEQNTREAVRLGFLKLPKKAMIDKRRINKLPPKNLCLIIAGSQGQQGSSLVRAAEQEHQLVKIEPGDKVVFSADPIPGNEQRVYNTIDALSRLGAEVSYSDVDDLLHVSGHASSWELKLLMALASPRYLLPIGGTFRHLIQYRKLAVEMGYREKNVFLLETGQTLNILKGTVKIGETIKLKTIMVDGLGIGDVGHIVLRDRQTLSEHGIVVVILPIDRGTKQLSGRIEIISRGFVYMKESKALINKVTQEVKTTVSDLSPKEVEWGYLKDSVSNHVEKLLYQETGRSPLVLPVIIEV